MIGQKVTKSNGPKNDQERWGAGLFNNPKLTSFMDGPLFRASKMPPAKIYRDEFSSRSSEDELPRSANSSFLHNRRNNLGREVDVIGNNRASNQEKWPPQSSQETILNL